MRAAEPKVIKKGGKQRFGKGFSCGELEKAEITLNEVRKSGIPIDFRRRTVHEENVEALKTFLKNKKKS